MNEKFQITTEERLRAELFEQRMARARAEMTLLVRERADFLNAVHDKYTESGRYQIVAPIVDGVGERAPITPVTHEEKPATA